MAEGRIITFYSFKGGVGRTMALANVAYLAAQNKKRVLVMDWDLEAPGLSYYFRGFVEPGQAEALRQAPGVLNVLWDWSQAAFAAKDSAQLDKLIARYETGRAFSECVRPIMDSDFLPEESLLDYIGAGSPVINTPEPVAYEQALSDFSWHTFFNFASGGLVIEDWRRWAKKNYDLVLVDSRTGLADAAGVCTMQLPDEVALCFILNRQNIEGIANVSAAIRANSGNRISLRAMPMRTARQDTAEEIDAKARAITELTKVGGFSSSGIQKDMQELSVVAAENVPFYETLAPFATYSTSLDLLSFNYRKLAQALLGFDIKEQVLDYDLRELVRRRLQGRHATLDYLTRLRTGEPERAAKELDVLIRTAMQDALEGQVLGEDYSEELIKSCFELETDVDATLSLQLQALSYLRALYAECPDRWRETLIRFLEIHLAYLRGSKISAGEEERVLVEEIDSLLSVFQDFPNVLRRVRFKQIEAQRFIRVDAVGTSTGVGEILMAQARELIELLHASEPDLSYENYIELQVADASLALLEGWNRELYSQEDRAATIYLRALERVNSIEGDERFPDLRRCRVDLLFRLAVCSSVPLEVRAEYAVTAAQTGADTLTFATRFLTLEKVVRESGDLDQWKTFVSYGLAGSDLTNQGVVNFYAVNPKRSIAFIDLIRRILDRSSYDVLLDSIVFKNVVEVIAAAVKFQSKTLRHSPDISIRRMIRQQGRELLMRFYEVQLSFENMHVLNSAVSSMGEGPEELYS